MRLRRAAVVEEAEGLIVGQDDGVGVHVRHANHWWLLAQRGSVSVGAW